MHGQMPIEAGFNWTGFQLNAVIKVRCHCQQPFKTARCAMQVAHLWAGGSHMNTRRATGYWVFGWILELSFGRSALPQER